MSQEDANARLLTSSCTSGWGDWLWENYGSCQMDSSESASAGEA